MAWSTIRRGCTVSLVLQLLSLQSISTSSQDKYSNNNRPHSDLYSKNRMNDFSNSNSAQFRPNNITSEQNINTRHFTSTPYNYSPNFVQGYNPYQYQQPVNFGYPGGAGINFHGTNGLGFPGSGYAGGTGIGFPSGTLTGYPGGNPGLIDEKGLLFPLPVSHYPQHNFQQSSIIKPPYQQSTSPFTAPSGFSGFYPNYPGLPTTPHNYNQNLHQGQSHFYPGHNHKSPHDGFDIGSLPRQVRVPGNIQVNLNGRNAEITCEFPRYLLLVQGVYWHHKYDPFGSYFDTQNRFGPRITVQSFDQWKSVLRIEEYVEDDFGIYRCISAAALPTDDKPIQFPAGGFSTRTGQLPSTTPIYQDASQEFDSGESQSREEKVKKRKNSRKMKFPPTQKIRFTRQAEKDNSLDQEQDDQYLSATIPSNYFPTSNNEPYDPFVNTRPYETPAHLRNGYLDYNNQNPYNNNNNFRYPSTPNQNPFIPNQNLQTNRHLFPGFGHYHGGFDFQTAQFPNSQTPGHGLQVPYYKPSYSIYTVFQEVTFQPVGGGVRSAALTSTSPNPTQLKT